MYTRIGIAIGVAALALAGCSSSGSSSSSSSAASSAAPTYSASPSESASVLPPIIIDGKEKAVTAKVGDTLDVTATGVTEVTTDNAQVLKVTQAHTDGSAEFNAGAEVVGAGTATLVAKGSSGEMFKVTVTATE